MELSRFFLSGSGNVQPDPTTEPVEVSGGARPSYDWRDLCCCIAVIYDFFYLFFEF